MQVLVLGAGQLAKMMAEEADTLGLIVRAFDVRTNQVVDPITKEAHASSLQAAIDAADIVTAEFEHIPLDILTMCENSGKLRPSATAIRTGGDRRIEKGLLDGAWVKNAAYKVIKDITELQHAVNTLGLPLVLKSAMDGYDGKGQWRLKYQQDVERVAVDISEFIKHSSDSQGIVAEQFVRFEREVSIIGARNQQGDVACYPITENQHHEGILHISVARGDESAELQAQAQQIFNNIANALNYVGVLAVECFVTGGQLLVNEIAPRVHNSGHWTQQGAATSQFSNHLRAVCDMPLGSTVQIAPTAMINILGEDELPKTVYQMPGVTVHWYGKEKRPGRKMGHINVTGQDVAELNARLADLASCLDPHAFPLMAQFA
ncbi:5-(carboxyamino)imidazole ribonucleotide synthase [Bowmanella sp. JS7-9]|uniref:N5-carboxyaminoimidazole ribonucleotide synthase n=1 Tax=Pseudobowmanella zhangzhouensis TaxID=1537679 RepID=A0ABW1XNE5_9ALTE|nr:5-(carboxyamino)imidazole ribonucleotide synthase [Bowmanella sp. JS7-9]TBX24371.1 phosphoribosylaminoimidazole carboxylase [Bowmanella sp. JS7-9]